MYCTKCGNQLEDGAKVCNSCGCPTEFYNQTVAITQEDNVIKFEVLLIFAVAATLVISLVYKLLYGENSSSLPDFLYQIPNLIYIAQSILLILFCILNIRIKSKLWKTASIITLLGSALLLINSIQYMLDYSNDINSDEIYFNLYIQFGFFRVVLFAGIALILIAINKIASLTPLQKVASILGSVLSIIYIPWLLFIDLPYGADESYSFYNELYQSFLWLLERDIIINIGGIFYIIIAIIFLKTKKAENQ